MTQLAALLREDAKGVEGLVRLLPESERLRAAGAHQRAVCDQLLGTPEATGEQVGLVLVRASSVDAEAVPERELHAPRRRAAPPS